MTENLHRYEFDAGVTQEDVDAALVLALWGTESLHGETETSINAQFLMDEETRVCLIDVGTVPGQDLSRLFHGYLRREMGTDCFRVRRSTKAEYSPELAIATG